MSWYLYRLGRWSFRHRKVVVSLWLALLVLAGVGASTLSGKTSDSFTLPNIESAQAFDLIKAREPAASPDGATAKVVFEAPEGSKVTDPDQKAAIEETVSDLGKLPHVASVVDPFKAKAISEDGTITYASATYDVQSIDLSSSDQDALRDVGQSAEDAGLRVEIGGDALTEIPESGSSELIGVVVALIVLVITFGSLIAAGMPLVSALIGVGIGVAGITTLTGFIDLGSTTPILATMLGLAVGIDYALFIVSRYRHEITIGREPEEAAGRAVGTAGSAVVFAGLTVLIALAGLSVVNISFLTEMGLAAAGTVAIAVLIALTLLPALAGFAGRKILSGKIPGLRGRDPEDRSGKRTFGRAWADFVTHHKATTFVAGLLVASVVAIPFFSMEQSLPDDGSQPTSTTQRQAYDLIAKGFGAGANGPLLVAVDTKNADNPQQAVEKATAAISGVKDDIVSVQPGELNAKADLALITVVPQSGPAESETQDLVGTLRDAVDPVEAETGAQVLVTGQTAVTVDVSESLADALPTYLMLVVGLAFVLLTLVFRSLLVPLSAVLGFLITIGVALGGTVAVFQWGWLAGLLGVDTAGPIMSLLPLLMIGILFGLAMDYQLFLVSRMREEYVHGKEAKDAVVHGFQYGARVVTAAAIIMISVFGSFIITDNSLVKPIGFGLALGILADAFLVRMTLIPAFMALVGKGAWWFPKWLDKIVPNFDIEGEQLTAHLADKEQPAEEEGREPADASAR